MEKLDTDELRKERYFDYKNTDKIFINPLLAKNLQSIAYNIKSDWDFVIIITGNRTVRVGKSVLAMQVGAYLSQCLKKQGLIDEHNYSVDDIYFRSQNMIDEALKKPKFSINHFDEGRMALSTSKAMKSVQQDILDFFAEAGQLNHIFILVLPDYFTLKEEIAVPRSEMLINVYRKKEYVYRDLHNTGDKTPVWKLKRGYFDVYNRKKKKKLYDLARRKYKKDYNIVKQSFKGQFHESYPVSEEKYKEKKKNSLSTFKERHKKKPKSVRKKTKWEEREWFLNNIKPLLENLKEDKSWKELGMIAGHQENPNHVYKRIQQMENFYEKHKDKFGKDSDKD